MNKAILFRDFHRNMFRNNWQKFLFWGIALVLLGTFAIYAATFTTLLSVSLLGAVITFGGIIIALDTFTLGWGKWSGYLLHFILAAVYLAVGIMLMTNPTEGSVSLTLLLGIFYIFMGITRILFASMLQMPKWGWAWFNGLITLLIGILILTNWPESSLFIIGLFIGIDLLVVGWTYIMAALAAKGS